MFALHTADIQHSRLGSAMMNTSAVGALLLCTDAQSLDTIGRLFSESTITSESCLTSGAALEALKEKDFDLLALDFDEPGAGALMEAWTCRGPNASKVAIAFACQGETLRQAQRKSAQFAVQKPLDKQLMSKTLKVAYDMVLKKRRAAYRYSVCIKADAITIEEDGTERKLKNPMLLDISEGGLCLKADAVISKKATVTLTFHLPETHDLIHVTGKFTPSEPGGVVGVKFSFVPAPELKKLQTWLDARNPLTPKVKVVQNPYQVREGQGRSDFRV
jgi:hypothetical protein